MRAETLRSLCFAGALVVLCVGCGGEPPAPRICRQIVVKLPDVPEEKRVSFGKACVQDSDCRSGLCDRGKCGDVYEKGNYGRECVPGPSPTKEQFEKAEMELVVNPEWLVRHSAGPSPPPPSVPDLPPGVRLQQVEAVPVPMRLFKWHRTPFGRNLCTGYLCLDGRCRSCQSDAECQWEGSAGPYCVHYFDWSGKRCSTLEEARLKESDLQPAIPQPLPASSTTPPLPGK
jgi:hypothetical protein